MFRIKVSLTLIAIMSFLQVTPTLASDVLPIEVKAIEFPIGANTLTATLTGAERFDIAWRLDGGDYPHDLFVTADSTFYYTETDKRAAVLPSGETITADAKVKEMLLPVPPSIKSNTSSIESTKSGQQWTFQLPGDKRLITNSLQTDSSGNLYIQDLTGGWYSLTDKGNLRYQLQIELGVDNNDLTCKVASSGDAVCMSPQLGLVGIREKTSAPLVIINGKEQFYAQKPFIQQGVTMVPLRGIFEELGATVKWNAPKQTITVKKGNTTIILTVNDKLAKINDRSAKLTEAPIVKGGTTFVPLRFISESLDAIVVWESSTSTIQIASSS